MSNYAASKFSKNDKNTSWHKTFQLVPSGSTVLDIGCSTGTFGERLIKEKKCTVDGVDIDDGDLKIASKKLRKTYKLNVETDELVLPEKYDVVFMGDTIEHLARPITALKKVRKVLKPNGSLVFSIPNITHMSVRLMILKGEITYGKTGLLDETHLHFYNAEEIYRVLNSAGFQIEKLDYTVNDIPIYILNEELAKLGLSVNKSFKKTAQSLNAAAYQFVGRAKPGVAKTQDLPKVSPLNVVSKYHERLKKDFQKHVQGVIGDRDRIKEEFEALLLENKKLTEENVRLKEENSSAVTSFVKNKFRRQK